VSKRKSRLTAFLASLALYACQTGVETPETSVFASGPSAALISECMGYSVGDAVSFLGHPLQGGFDLRARDCLATATDCQGVFACLGYTVEACEEGCDGAVARHCQELPNKLLVSWHEDCSQDVDGNHECKLTIDEGKGNYSRCYEGAICDKNSCVEGAAVLCDHGTSKRFACAEDEECRLLGEASLCVVGDACEGDRCDDEQTLARCNGGVVELRARCEDIVPGTVCTQIDSTQATCQAKTPHPSCPKNQPFSEHCEGDVAIACRVGVRYEIDCALTGDRCVSSDGAARCAAPD
jgi:hypothetical protein